MPSRRMIDPALWKSENLAKHSRDTRLLFIGLFSNADDQGRLRAHPAVLKSEIFMYDNDITWDDIGCMVSALADSDEPAIQTYRADGKDLIQILNWWKWQHPTFARPSELPPPPDWRDRICYRKGNTVIKENWGDDEAEGEAEPDEDEPTATSPRPHADITVSGAPRDRGRDSGRGRLVGESGKSMLPASHSPPDGGPPSESEHQAIFAALQEEVYRYDGKLLSKDDRAQLGAEAKLLRKANYTSREVLDGARDWWANDWRGKKGSPPLPKQFRALLGRRRKARESQPQEADPCR